MGHQFNITTLFFVVVFFALMNTGLYIIADKWNVINWYEGNRKTWMPNKCEYCLFFWMAVIELMGWYFTTLPFDWFTFFSIFALSICAAVISRFML